MKRFFNTQLNQKIADLWLLVFRISIAACMLTHGIPKLETLLSGEEIKFINFLGLGQTASFTLTVFAEFFCSCLLLSGFAVRLASIPLVINMSVAVLVGHNGDPFIKKELAVIYLLLFLTFFVFGGGKYSVDHLIFSRKK